MNSGLSAGTQRGIDALRRGDHAEALRVLEAEVAQRPGDLHALLGIALAARASARFDRALEAADAILEIEPGNIGLNIVKGDALTGLGRPKAAASFYMAALRAAAQAGPLPPDLAQELNRVQGACRSQQAQFAEQMREKLAELGVIDGKGRTRMEQAVDILFARKQVFLQQPSKLFYPELAHIQFYDPDAFAWSKAIAAGKAEIKAELAALVAGEDPFEPYMKHNPIAPAAVGFGLHEDQRWSAFHLYKDGVEIRENSARCPRTLEIIEAAPIARIPGRSPNILFSRLAPGAHIPPHHGQMNTRLLVHLPLVVPAGCELRVGNQTRAVAEGELMIFDDSIEHEARNTSSQSRIVLIFDIWRPELDDAERALVCAICEVTDDIQ